MAITITEDCINCAACITECPNTAIYEGGNEWSFADGTDLRGTVEFNGNVIDADASHPALSDDIYYIVSEKCTECVGFHDEPRCASVCPVECCVPNADYVEAHDALLTKQAVMHFVNA
jgi:ferredoxin